MGPLNNGEVCYGWMRLCMVAPINLCISDRIATHWNFATLQTTKHPDFFIMWGSFSYYGVETSVSTKECENYLLQLPGVVK